MYTSHFALKRVVIFFISLCIHEVHSQAKPEWNAIFNKINTEVQTNSKAYSSLKTATETIGHRLTGSANGEKAEAFAYNLLKF